MVTQIFEFVKWKVKKMSLMMCLECGEGFDAFDADTQHESMGDGYSTRYNCCPACHSSQIEYAIKCELCGEYAKKEDATGNICETCFNEMISNIEVLKAYIKARNEEKEFYLDWMYDCTVIGNYAPINELTTLMKEYFYKDSDKPEKRAYILSKLKEYIINCLEDFAEWISENLREVREAV